MLQGAKYGGNPQPPQMRSQLIQRLTAMGFKVMKRKALAMMKYLMNGCTCLIVNSKKVEELPYELASRRCLFMVKLKKSVT